MFQSVVNDSEMTLKGAEMTLHFPMLLLYYTTSRKYLPASPALIYYKACTKHLPTVLYIAELALGLQFGMTVMRI